VILKCVGEKHVTQTMSSTPESVRAYSDTPQESSDAVNASLKDTQKPPPLRSLITRPVLVSIANYAILTLLEMASMALFPLMWSTSVEFGGLGFSPVSIGLCFSVLGCIDGIFQFASSRVSSGVLVYGAYSLLASRLVPWLSFRSQWRTSCCATPSDA
jgi:hypothetical protein